MQETPQEEVDVFTDQRRLRHVTEVLVRNLSIPASFTDASATWNASSRPPYGRSAYSLSHADGAPPVAGPSSFAVQKSDRPSFIYRRSKDDLDLPALHRRHPARRKLTISSGGNSALLSTGSTDVLPQNRDHRPSSIAERRADVKGKGRERDLLASRDTLNSIQESEATDGLPTEDTIDGLPPDDSDVIFGWTSATKPPVPITRSRSKSSLKSSSSKRSISSTVSKRLFKQNRRRRNSLIGSEDDEDSDASGSDTSRKGSGTRHERPQSPLAPHVSFQMAVEHSPQDTASFKTDSPFTTLAANRARSASRGSILSVASGSSASTIRASSVRHSEKAERLLRVKRYEDVRSHLVRSRLTLSVSTTEAVADGHGERMKRPAITRTRTISLPLRGAAGQESDSPNTQPQSGPTQPFYISAPHKRSMEPSFPLDFSPETATPTNIDAASKRHRVIAAIWVELDPPQTNPSGDDSGWKLLTEWEIDLRKLMSLGTDPRLFPRKLPANTLIFKVSTTDEYLTARLPAFMLFDTNEEREEGLETQQPVNNDFSEEEGNVSDPGPMASTARKRRSRSAELSFRKDATRERERLVARSKMIIDRSVRETRMVQSVDDNELRSLIEMELDMKKLQAANLAARERVDGILAEQIFKKDRQHSGRLLLRQQYIEDKTRVASSVETSACQCQQRRQQLEARRSRIADARQVLQDKEAALRLSQENHQLDVNVYRSIQLSTSQRRALLISELSTIFPVDLVDAANILFSICGLPLPNGDFETQQALQSPRGVHFDDDHISSALGYVSQAVQLLAAYLCVPLYYPLRCMGSRSLVQDPISQMKGPKIFPLYARGVDKYRFEYAVFLLNKNIEQIMLEYNIGLMDLSQTLPNLKNMYLTLSSDASTSSTTQARRNTLSTPAPALAPPIVLGESKPASHSRQLSLDAEASRQANPTISPQVNGNMSSRPNGTTTSALEKILGASWSSRSRSTTTKADTENLPQKGRRRNAEESKTMTLLGGRSSATPTHV